MKAAASAACYATSTGSRFTEINAHSTAYLMPTTIYRGQVETTAGDVLMRQGDLHRNTPFSAAEVDHTVMLVPGNLAAIARAAPALTAVIARVNCAIVAGSV
jgi:predicted TIM-barrel enzyme